MDDTTPQDDSRSTPGRGGAELRMLDAGIDLWVTQDPATTFGGLSVASVAKAAGVTRATFYAYWPTTNEYFRALLDHLDSKRPSGVAPLSSEEITRVRAEDGRVLSIFMEICRQRFLETIDTPAMRVRFGFASKLDDAEVAEGLRRLYRNYEHDTQRLNEEVHNRWGREPRPPFTDPWIQSILGALLDGMALRHLIDPEQMPEDSFGLVSAMVTMLATRTLDDHRDTYDLLGTMNQWPSAGFRVNTSRRAEDAQQTIPLSEAALRAVVSAAGRMVAEGSWQALDIDEIAAGVGIDADRLLRTFGSKIGLGMALLAANADEQWQLAERTDDPLVDLATLLDIIVTEYRRSPSLGQSLIQILSGSVRLPDPVIFARQPIPEIARLLEEAKDAGLIRPEIDPRSLSVSITRIVLVESAPVTASGIAQTDSLRYLIEGIRVAP